MTRATLALLALLAGCSCVEYRALDVDSRAKLEERERFVVLTTRLVEVDGFSDAPGIARAFAADYAPVVSAQWTLRPAEEAPEPLRGMVAAAHSALVEKGYVPATAAEGPGAPDLVVVVSHCWLQSGALHRVSVAVGGLLDGKFRRDLVSLDAKLPEDGGCEADPVDLVRDLLGALPERGEDVDDDEEPVKAP